MSVDVALEADAQLAKGSQPSMGALDHPTMAPQPIIAFNAPTGDAVLDAMTPQMRPTARVVVALVGMQFCRPALRSTATAPNGWQRVNQLLENNRIVTIGTSDAEHHRDAPAVRDQKALAAELASVRGIRPGVRAPRGLGTLAPSTLARLKSSAPAPRNSASNSRCNRCHTPAACHSRSLRQQVMPLPNPSSWGKSSHGMPVRSTNKIPLSAARSESRGRPAPVLLTLGNGSSGSIRSHSR